MRIGNLLYKSFDFRCINLGHTSKTWRLSKLGVARKPGWRWKHIDKSVKGSKERVVFYAPVLFARVVEKALLFVTLPLKEEFKGSGKTEWRRFYRILDFPIMIFIGLLSLFSYLFLLAAVIFLIGIIWMSCF